MKYTIRKLRPEDEEAVLTICFLTLDNNNEKYRELSGLHWAVPYLRYELENCFAVADAEDIPVGYILSSPEAKNFRKLFRPRMKKEIKQALRKQRKEFPLGMYIREYIESVHYTNSLPRNMEQQYPAHLHINILPEHQGKGLGVMLIKSLVDHLKDMGCSGVHLGVSRNNTGAIRFYERTGFKLLKKRRFGTLYYGLKL